jgi:hypothetical protein
MRTLKELFQQNRAWAHDITSRDPEFFLKLSSQQTPRYLWIGCADSRVPANEIVVPIIIMSYMATGSILELSSLDQLRALLVDNDWTWLTAVCTMLFSLMHWPCGTTCLTIRRETGGIKWTALSILIPTAAGVLICFIVAGAARLLGLA